MKEGIFKKKTCLPKGHARGINILMEVQNGLQNYFG